MNGNMAITSTEAESGETCYVAGHLGIFRFLTLAILAAIESGYRPVLSF